MSTLPSSPAPSAQPTGTDVDEESLAGAFAKGERLLRGVFFTPRPVTDTVLELVRPHLPEGIPLAVVDPACGAGAFLAAANRAFPAARLLGLELSESSAAHARRRLPTAQIRVGDALRGGVAELLSLIPPDAFQVWVGNPPYNGTSPLLSDPKAYASVRALLPGDYALPKGTSLRDDFAFFLLQAAQALARASAGVLAFLTPSTLLDAFLYAPVRQALLERLQLCEVADLGGGIFQEARVRTCLTVWSSHPRPGATPTARFRRRRVETGDGSFAWDPEEELQPAPPTWNLRPASAKAQALDARWRDAGELLTSLLPLHYPGLKTRFDELLVDEDPGRLLARIDEFLHRPEQELPGFARSHGIPERHLRKLGALHQATRGLEADPAAIRRFFRYAGAKHRDGIPDSAKAYCYLHRRFIPRGDHRLQKSFDPHAPALKLVFNTRELPVCATIVEEAGCVHAHRHTRFAPLLVPGPAKDSKAPGEVVNLSPRAFHFAEQLGGPAAFFRALARFINGAQVQQVWAPAFGTGHDLPIPLDAQLFDEGLAAS